MFVNDFLYFPFSLRSEIKGKNFLNFKVTKEILNCQIFTGLWLNAIAL